MSQDFDERFLALLAEEGNGAVEAHLPEGTPLRVVIIGPIKTWWGRIDSPEYKEYALWRDAVRVACIHEGHLVYSPHRAWQGAWHESAQKVNDLAIIEGDVVIVLTPPDIESVGSLAESVVAREYGIPLVDAPPAGETELWDLLQTLNKIKASLSR